MSDLSRLLEDVYQSSSAAPPGEAPAWSSEDALEQVFSEWVPGPPDEAPAQERAMFAGTDEIPTTAEDPVDWEAAIAALAPLASRTEDEAEAEAETVPLLDEQDDHAPSSMAFGAFELFESVISDLPRKDAELRDPDGFLAALETADEEEAEAVPVLATAGAPSIAGWCRDDDDILPARSARRFRLTLRR